MPRSRPPLRALHGQLEARPSHRAHESRELPIRVAESTAAERGSSPVAGLIKHAAAIKAVDEEPVVILRADWRYECNHLRLHSSLGYLTPVEFNEAWNHQHQQRLLLAMAH